MTYLAIYLYAVGLISGIAVFRSPVLTLLWPVTLPLVLVPILLDR